MSGQKRYWIFRFTSPDGTRATLCTDHQGTWEEMLDLTSSEDTASGWTPWLLPWNSTRARGRETEGPDGAEACMARVNLAHVMSVETWSVLR